MRQLAAGGQASVWLADRTDQLVNRPVAVKLPHGLGHRPDLAERMAREREILATLHHPHIARLYDAGVTPEGDPFLALEYVEGTTIDEHCRERGLTITDRLHVFLQVLRAVAYAHAQLVIHRDLQPSNVLVTADGSVRLLDFGIARLINVDPDLDSTLTAVGGRAMTLAYASPEQVARQPLGVATDVYSDVAKRHLVAPSRRARCSPAPRGCWPPRPFARRPRSRAQRFLTDARRSPASHAAMWYGADRALAWERTYGLPANQERVLTTSSRRDSPWRQMALST